MENEKWRTLIVTGKTERQLADEMKILDLADNEGFQSPPLRICYLCKRAEGEKSLCLIEGEPDKVNLTELELEGHSVSFESGITLIYLICQECAILLNLEEGIELEEE
jgi:hypothetical protein